MKTVVLTGVTSGIGRVIEKSFKENKWKVIGLTRKEIDLSDLSKVTKLAEKLVKEHDPIDAVIHVAGIWHDTISVYADKKLQDYTASQIIETINVGLTSFMVLSAYLLAKIPKNGTVIGISGTFGDGAAGWLPYYTSKRALEDFLVGLEQDYPKGPKVFGISPADTATNAYRKFYPEYAAEAQPPEAIANLCLELSGNQSKHKSGDIIEVRNEKTQSGFHI